MGVTVRAKMQTVGDDSIRAFITARSSGSTVTEDCRDYPAKNIGHRGPKEQMEKGREKPGTEYLIFLFNPRLNKQHRSSLVLKD